MFAIKVQTWHKIRTGNVGNVPRVQSVLLNKVQIPHKVPRAAHNPNKYNYESTAM